MPYVDITSDALAKLSLPPDATDALPGGRLTATVQTITDDGPPHKRIAVQVAWPMGDGPERTMDLTAWKYDLPPAATP
ncbi:MAG: hypothetical protein IT427_07435 [Pirellulales bacterium]|nr:hypothetical protein [Pirellulales bacterium]